MFKLRFIFITLLLVFISLPVCAGEFPIALYFGTNASNVSDAADAGANTLISYSLSSGQSKIISLLDAAQDENIGVILQVWQPEYDENTDELLSKTNNPYYSWFTGVLGNTTICNHSALRGWYIADEPAVRHDGSPTPWSTLVAQLEDIYVDVTDAKDKDVFIVHARSAGPGPDSLQNAADIYMYDAYPLFVGEDEFGNQDGVEDFPLSWDFWKMWYWKNDATDGNGKPYWYIGQAFGYQDPSTAKGWKEWRLMTMTEYRYLTFASICKYSNGASGYGAFSYERMLMSVGKNEPIYPAAGSNDPYSGNGEDWRTDVWDPVTEQLKIASYALAEGAVTGVHTRPSGFLSQVYQDPEDGRYYLMTTSDHNTTQNDKTFDFDGLASDYTVYKAYDTEDQEVISIGSNNEMTDSYGPYDAKLYEVGVSLCGNPHFRDNKDGWIPNPWAACTVYRSSARPSAAYGWYNSTAGSLRVQSRVSSSSSAMYYTDVSDFIALGEGQYRIRLMICPEDAADKAVAGFALYYDGSWHYYQTWQSTSKGSWKMIEQTRTVSWNNAPTDAYIYVKTSGTSDFWFDDLEIIKLP